MDNLAHTLVGAALGRAVGGERVPRAALIGAIAANAPDWTEIPLGLYRRGTHYLVLHRGITHSFLGAGVEIAGLTVIVGLILHFAGRRNAGVAPVAWGLLTACVAATVLSHLWMDWQGSYGLRPFLPWSATWYYGDWVAIVDPFFWIVPLIALAWGDNRHWLPALAFAAIGVIIAVVLWRADGVTAWVKPACVLLGLIGIVGWHRHWVGVRGRRVGAALGMAVVVLYTLAQGAASVPAKRAAARTARGRFGPGAQYAALTMPGRPFQWRPIYANQDTVAGPGWVEARNLELPAVRQAILTEDGHAVAQFARFLVARVESHQGETDVTLCNARCNGRRGFSTVTVTVPGE